MTNRRASLSTFQANKHVELPGAQEPESPVKPKLIDNTSGSRRRLPEHSTCWPPSSTPGRGRGRDLPSLPRPSTCSSRSTESNRWPDTLAREMEGPVASIYANSGPTAVRTALRKCPRASEFGSHDSWDSSSA